MINMLDHVKVEKKVKSLHKSQVAHQISGFCSIKWLGVFLP